MSFSLRTHPSPAGVSYYTILFIGIMIGVCGITYNLTLSNPQPLERVISMTAALTAFASGLGLYLVPRKYAIPRVIVGLLVAGFASYSIGKSLLYGSSIFSIQAGLISTSIHWPLSVMYVLIGVLITLGFKQTWQRLAWRYSAVFIFAVGTLYFGLSWLQSGYVLFGPHPMVVSISILYTVTIAIAIWFGGEHGTKLARLPSRFGMMVGAGGILIPTFIWFALSVHEAQSMMREGTAMSSEAAKQRQETSWRSVNLMSRLVERWSSASDDELARLQELDITRYLNDETHIRSILLFAPNSDLLWERNRTGGPAFAPRFSAGEQTDAELQAWLSKPEPYAAILIPRFSIRESVPVVVLRLPVFRHGELYAFVVTVFDFASLVNPTLSELNSSFKTYAQFGEVLLSSRGHFTEILSTEVARDRSLFYTQAPLYLPYSPPTLLNVYLADTSELRFMANIHTLVLLGGYLLAVFLVISTENGQILRRQRVLLRAQATQDKLTGLANRAVIERTLLNACEQVSRSQQRVAVMFIDLDGFKPINDSLGLIVGDKLLVETAKRLERCCTEGVLASRFGSDEFVIVVTGDTSAARLEALVNHILSAIAQPFHIDDYRLYITASVGITTTSESPADPKLLIQHADMAMYQAKRQGRNHYQFFAKNLIERFHEAVVLRNQLQQAIDKNELMLYYQPVVACGSRKVVGVEALLRWEIEPGRFVSPAEFIPLAEDSGQIIPMSAWVLQQACEDGLTIRTMRDITLAVNLSAVQFQRANFVESLEHHIRRSKFPANKLRLELTESILVEDQREAIQILKSLRQRELGISIDDFGTGFSSLSYLKDLPANQLKIDRSFIADIQDPNRDGAIVRGIIAMANELGIDVIAEGVETEVQARFVETCGAKAMQGYYFAKPMPLAALIDFLADEE
ncbi:putative bifunctional diguanylate cyclase/phosphodiesterase [Aliidiomarina celeris]|uniref:putative bifunctional diguanylate cyclase/phosphodiesterase n=1 Tax=Aliidiomarina celeris TaxID=2249428 RepID=UPI0013005B2D|nr:EAL domain-containing protein [Aliidiomarina celeris]